MEITVSECSDNRCNLIVLASELHEVVKNNVDLMIKDEKLHGKK